MIFQMETVTGMMLMSRVYKLDGDGMPYEQVFCLLYVLMQNMTMTNAVTTEARTDNITVLNS